jgi:hypothetical protein
VLLDNLTDEDEDALGWERVHPLEVTEILEERYRHESARAQQRADRWLGAREAARVRGAEVDHTSGRPDAHRGGVRGHCGWTVYPCVHPARRVAAVIW